MFGAFLCGSIIPRRLKVFANLITSCGDSQCIHFQLDYLSVDVSNRGHGRASACLAAAVLKVSAVLRPIRKDFGLITNNVSCHFS